MGVHAIFISQSGLPFASCPANIPKCWPFGCKVHALESPPNTRGIVCSCWQPGVAHLHHSIPGKENEPETELKGLQFAAGERRLKFYSCLMLDTFLWSQLQHIAELINLAPVSDTHKFSLFFSGWAVHEMIWVSSSVFVIHKDSQNSLDQHFSACNTLRLMICNPLSTFHGWWFVFQVKRHYLCLPGSDRSFIIRIVISIE